MKKIIVGLTVLLLVIVWYFFAPIKWTFGLRAPKNYQECKNMGGKDVDDPSEGFGHFCKLNDFKFTNPNFY